MEYFNVEVEFIDGTKVVIEVKAETKEEALQKAMPINLRI
jgi:hypothetical protein